MHRCLMTLAALATLATSTFGQSPPTNPPTTAPAGTPVLDTKAGPWRTFVVYRTPVLIDANGEPVPLTTGGKNPRPVPTTSTAEPPATWMAPEFDDSAWLAARGPFGPGQGIGQSMAEPSMRPYHSVWNIPNAPWPGQIHARSRFHVADPAAANGLKLSIAYVGGVVVYVNGQELKRAHLPAGELTSRTLAERYAKEAYLRPDGKQLSPGSNAEWGTDSTDFPDRFAMRGRSLTVEIPAAMLRKGANLIAVAAYRSGYDAEAVKAPFSKTNYRGAWGPWPHAHLGQIRLTAPTAGVATGNLVRPKGPLVWTCPAATTARPEDWASHGETIRPIALSAVTNAEFSGQIVVSSPDPIRKLKVTVGELAASGVSLGASAAVVRYALPGEGRLDPLGEQAPADGAAKFQPVWITVRVPADAKPALYEGAVTVEAEGLAATTVPLRIRVHGWRMPDAKDYLTHNDLWQSTESVALRYKAPLWSDKHFELIGKSLALSKTLANKLCETHLMPFAEDIGNSEGMVYWIDKGEGKYEYDFTTFERYLDTYAANVGKPGILLIDVWKWAADRDNKAPGGFKVAGENAVKLSRRDPATGKVDLIKQPLYGSADSLAFWKPVLDELRKRLEKRGWMDVACLGTGSDDAPRPPTVGVFKQIWPDVPWFSSGHVCPTSYKAGEKDSVPVRAAEWVWGAGNLWSPGNPQASYPRPWTTAPKWYSIVFPREGTAHAWLRQFYEPGDYRWNPEKTLQCDRAGIGRSCLDCWPIPGRSGLVCGAPGQYNFPAAVTAFLHPGPDGAMPTMRSEMFREGVQVREAISYLLQSADSRKLDAALANRCNSLARSRASAMLAVPEQRPWQAEEDALFALCAEVAAASRK